MRTLPLTGVRNGTRTPLAALRWTVLLAGTALWGCSAAAPTTQPAPGPAALAGNAAPPATQPRAAPHLVYLFPGVEGGAFLMHFPRTGLREGGVQADIRVFDWQRPFQGLANLTRYEENRAKAAAVAAQLAEWRRANPDGVIDLVGYSGGGGMAVLVAEAVAPDVRLRHIVLCQAAISPTYDLSTVLRHSTGRIYNFYARGDWFILGAGTSVFGTIDRSYTVSAGKEGFDARAAVPDAAQRGRLVQRAWTSDMVLSGHFGTHSGMLTSAWNRDYVAPALRLRAPASQPAASATRPRTP